MTQAKVQANTKFRLYLGLTIILISLPLTYLAVHGPADEPVRTQSPISVDANKTFQRVPQPVDLAELAERLNAGPPPQTPEQAKEHEKLIASQIADAAASLENIDPSERVGAAEQLAAYPTREAETLLNKALQSDMEKEVRQAAAVSLGYVKKPKQETINLLLTSLRDPAAEVRAAALETLTRYFAHNERDSTRIKQIIKGLKNASKSKYTPPDTREDIRDWLQEQSANSPFQSRDEPEAGGKVNLLKRRWFGID